MRGDNSMYVGGFHVGAVGADIGANVHVWALTNRVPSSMTCEPNRKWTVPVPYTDARPSQLDIHNNLSHFVGFETGVSESWDAQWARLRRFVQQVAFRDRPPGGVMRR